ncbi:MAG: cytochrome c maturation protein CcmE [bacterium]|nr:MAG: cytochrome c maturation protein CcmE [bacterium]
MTKGKVNIRTIVAVLALLGGVAYLIVSSISETGVYYRTVSEVLASPTLDRALRVSGKVVEGTVNVNQERLFLAFEVSDLEDRTKTLKAIYSGVVPDAFKEDAEVILEGSYDRASNTFNAVTLLAKCPSKYVADASQTEASAEKEHGR